MRLRELKRLDYQQKGLTFPMNIKYYDRYIYTGKRNIPHEAKYQINDLIRFEI